MAKSPRIAKKPPEAWDPLYRLMRAARRPLDQFLAVEASSGIVLIAAALIAILWVNSSHASSYHALWHTSVGFTLGEFSFHRSLEWVVNDGLMAIFFFVVGLEIRREIYQGELSELRRAALPLAAALGGMLVPAALYMLIAGGQLTRSGWGIPMATDIAFALGILALLGNRVPPALRVLLLALAVIDDLGAIVVIAIFYSTNIVWSGFGVAAIGIGVIIGLQWIGTRSKLAYVAPALTVWAGIYATGVHPTIAGVIIGFLTPVRALLTQNEAETRMRKNLDDLADPSTDTDLAHCLADIDLTRREAIAPSESIIAALHPWVAYFIMPIFALANSGVSLSGVAFDGPGALVAVGVGVGLLVGKPVGVIAMAWLTTKLGICTLPKGIGGAHLLVLGLVAGVGFTMSLFIAALAFSKQPVFLADAKLGILAGSTLAALIALGVGRALLKVADHGGATTAAQAEASTEL